MDTQSPSLINRLFKRVSGHSPDNLDDLFSILRQANAQDLIDSDTLSRQENLLKFNQKQVRDVMISRAQMDVLKTTDSIERIIAYTVDTAHSRFPVIAEDKDHVIGILHAKDLLKYISNADNFKLEHILRPAVFVPEGKAAAHAVKRISKANATTWRLWWTNTAAFRAWLHLKI